MVPTEFHLSFRSSVVPTDELQRRSCNPHQPSYSCSRLHTHGGDRRATLTLWPLRKLDTSADHGTAIVLYGNKPGGRIRR